VAVGEAVGDAVGVDATPVAEASKATAMKHILKKPIPIMLCLGQY